MYTNAGRSKAPKDEAGRVAPWLGPLSWEAGYNPSFHALLCESRLVSVPLQTSASSPETRPWFCGELLWSSIRILLCYRGQKCWITGRDSAHFWKAWVCGVRQTWVEFLLRHSLAELWFTHLQNSHNRVFFKDPMKLIIGIKCLAQFTVDKKCSKNVSSVGAWLAHLEEHATLNFRVMSSSPTLGIDITKKK